MPQHFTVRIQYREPSYERVEGPRAEPYRWTYEVSAADASDAEKRAVEEFHRVTRLSSSGWVREIQGIEVTGTSRRGASTRGFLAKLLGHTRRRAR